MLLEVQESKKWIKLDFTIEDLFAIPIPQTGLAKNVYQPASVFILYQKQDQAYIYVTEAYKRGEEEYRLYFFVTKHIPEEKELATLVYTTHRIIRAVTITARSFRKALKRLQKQRLDLTDLYR